MYQKICFLFLFRMKINTIEESTIKEQNEKGNFSKNQKKTSIIIVKSEDRIEFIKNFIEKKN